MYHNVCLQWLLFDLMKLNKIQMKKILFGLVHLVFVKLTDVKSTYNHKTLDYKRKPQTQQQEKVIPIRQKRAVLSQKEGVLFYYF